MNLVLYDRVKVMFRIPTVNKMRYRGKDIVKKSSELIEKTGKVFCVRGKDVQIKLDNSNCKLNFNLDEVVSVRKIE
jgi:hypothetical protein